MLKKHRPPHIYRDNQIYFLTSRTYKEICYFNNDSKKEILKSVLIKSIKRFNIKIYAWVIIDNHYHLLFDIKRKFPSSQFANPGGDELGNSEITSKDNFASKYQLVEFIRKIHKDSSRILNKIDNTPKRKIWYQYWDHCIRDEEDFYKHFNYIHNNPIKHKKVRNIEELYKYKYSSFNNWIKKKGREWMISCFEDYPILDYSKDI
jgi:putative transposase